MSDDHRDNSVSKRFDRAQKDPQSAEQKRRERIRSIKDPVKRKAIETLLEARDHEGRKLHGDQKKQLDEVYKDRVKKELRPGMLQRLVPKGVSISYEAQKARLRLEVEAKLGPMHKDQRRILYRTLTKEIDKHIDTAKSLEKRPPTAKERQKSTEAKRSEFRQTSRDVARQAPKSSGQKPSGRSR